MRCWAQLNRLEDEKNGQRVLDRPPVRWALGDCTCL